MRAKALPLSIAAILASGVVTTQADEAPTAQADRAIPMPVIEVVGKRVDDAKRLTGSVVMVDREQIEAIQPLSTEDALRRVPGINIKSEEETSIVANFGIRGLSASESKSLMLEDGVPVAPGLFIGNERYFNPRIQRVENIEVLKGSASLRYGPSTIGGVVNYQTKNPQEGVLISARAGSYDMREVSIEAGATTVSGDAFMGVVATHAESDGFMNKGYDMDDVMIKAGLAINDAHTLGLKVSWYDNDANISYRGLLLDDYRKGAEYNPAPDDYFLTDRQSADVSHEWVLNSQATLKTVAYYSEVTRDYWRYSVDTAASTTAGRWVYTDALTGNNRAFERVGFESRLQLTNTWFGLDGEAEFGLRYMEEESNDTRIRATRTADRTGINDRHRVDSADDMAAYVQNRFEINDRLALTPGLRVESYEQRRVILSDNNASAKTRNTEWLPGLGATYEVNDAAQIFGGVYRAFSPAANEVALDGLQDQQLDGERSTNFEFGVRGTQGALNYEVAAFYMDFDNQVVTGNSDPNLSQSNAGQTTHAGMEASFGYVFGNGFSIDANATWVPESDFETGDYRGNRLPYAPKVLANLSLNYQRGDFSGGVFVHHRGEQYGTPDNQIALPTGAAGGIWGGRLAAYTITDAVAQYEVNSNLTVFGSVKNLMDERAITGLRQGIYVAPGRSVEMGVRIRL
ncbi:outer membrane iron(III) dicitrate receptor [Aequoribacter fuscus]|uniref:Outer membrane iron(III) dicitrate receptor n=1 Tax=Aequoribacter fuscus TaxID=2518989 RepID=F3L0F9_9GAMM|nr:TonB-dependent receptor [Aequoribacter fuscus]EGG30177.1 outer membrane iron(III) dicitrate receptor [Aequoribacter fuscus]